MRKGMHTLASVALVTALVAGGFAHAIVPHDEGDHHSKKEIVWNSLHAALSHEQKYAALPLLAAFMAVAVMLAFTLPGRHAYEVIGSDRRHRQLRRGVAAFRRFG